MEPFVGEIRYFAFGFAPRGWIFCNGQVLPIQQNQALFALLGTTFGGNGTTNFAVPDLRGRLAQGFNSSFPLGNVTGQSSVTLSINEMPGHTHRPNCNDAPATSASPAGNVWARESQGFPTYASTPSGLMAAGASGVAGASQPHENRMPFLTLNACIAVVGIFPPRT